MDAVIDVRLRNTSHLAGYTKRDTLAFLLREGFAIAVHQPVTLEALSELKGVGSRRLEQYETAVIELVRKHLETETK